MASKTKKTLWEINSEIAELQEQLADCIVEDNKLVNIETGEQFPLDILDSANAEHEEKMKNCLYVYKHFFAKVEAGLIAQRDMLYAEIDKINAKIKSNEKSKKNFGAYMSMCTKKENWKAQDGSFSCWTQDDISTEIINPEYIPSKYFTIKIERNPDRKKIKAAIEAGEYIKGAKLTHNASFRVR